MNGSDKRDRKVEPIRFIRNDQLIEAFEVESQTTKHFQLDRMADIRRLQVPFQHKARHQSKVTDPFYIADVAQTEIILEMSLRAGQRMKEDYKDTLPYLQEGLENFVYRGPVNAQFINLDRWLMGWCDEVRILKPDSLKTHLEKLWTAKKL
jgi:predicted DNA-binding transcriptional regulator YafY